MYFQGFVCVKSAIVEISNTLKKKRTVCGIYFSWPGGWEWYHAKPACSTLRELEVKLAVFLWCVVDGPRLYVRTLVAW